LGGRKSVKVCLRNKKQLFLVIWLASLPPVAIAKEYIMRSKELERRVLISTGERGLRREMPEQIRTDIYGFKIWNIQDEKDRELIRIGTEGTDEEVHEAFSKL